MILRPRFRGLLVGTLVAAMTLPACPSRRAVEPTPRPRAGADPAAGTSPPDADPPSMPAPPRGGTPLPPLAGAAPLPPPPPPVAAAPQGDPPPVPEPPRGAAPPTVRIQLVSVVKAGRAGVAADGGWTLRALDGTSIASGREDFRGELRIEGSSADLGAFRLPRDGAVLAAASLRVGARRYPGKLRISRTADGTVRVAVETDLETYLEGVVLGELPPDFPTEARRVQAVIARTYALAQPAAKVTPDAILVDDSGLTDQEYAGSTAKPELLAAARDAVATTRGLVLVRGGEPIRAWYHSTCGGRTCDARTVFRVPEAEGITGVVCGSCTSSPRYRWQERLPAADVVKAAGLSGTLTGFATGESVEGGRAATFRVTAGGRTKVLPAADFRLAVGPSRLRSTWIDRAVVEGADLVLAGRGWGHGVGLCQWGARERASRGERAETILLRYYVGTELRRLW